MNVLLMVLLLAVIFALWIAEVVLGKTMQKKLNSGARVSGPLFSLSASGTVGKAFTFGTWKGIPYVREWFKPQNPNDPKQINVRTAMRIAVVQWQNLNAPAKAAYEAGAAGKGYSGFNLAIKRMMNAYVLQLTTDVLPVSVGIVGDYPLDVITWSAI